MLESLHRACGCLLIPNFRASLVLPEHQSLAKHCSADEEIRKGQYMAGNGLGFFRGVNVWTGEMIGNYEQYGTWASSRINLYLTAYSLVSISSAPSTVSPMSRHMRGWPADRGGKDLLPIFSFSSHYGSVSRWCWAQTPRRLWRLSALSLATLHLTCYKNTGETSPSAPFYGDKSPSKDQHVSSDTRILPWTLVNAKAKVGISNQTWSHPRKLWFLKHFFES